MGGPRLVQLCCNIFSISGCFATSVLSLLATDLPLRGNSLVCKTVAQPIAPSLLSRLKEDGERGVKYVLVSVSRCVLRRKHIRLRSCDLVFLSCP